MFWHVLAQIGPYLDQYGYWAVFGGVFLEGLGIPVPGELLLIAGAIIAGSTGRMSILLLLPISLAAAIAGDNLAYAIGRFAGRHLVIKYGHFVFITAHRLSRAEFFYLRYGPPVVAIARFLTLMRQLNGIVAGVSNMNWRRFFLYDAVGAVLWVGLWGPLSFWLGTSSVNLINAVLIASPVLAVVGLGVTFLVLRRFHRGEAPIDRSGS